MMWYEKYRPRDMDDYVHMNQSVRNKIEQWVANPADHPSLILSGPTGTGKTTLALIIRNQLDLGNDALFIPSSLQSGVETIRDKIVSFCEVGGFHGLKLIIMDEADRLSRDAQEMLRNVIDIYKGSVRFIFTCNNLSKIIEPIQGRTWVLDVQKLDPDAFLENLIKIAEAEGVALETDEESGERLWEISNSCYPNMRRAISKLQWSFSEGRLINRDQIEDAGDWEDEIEAVMTGKFNLDTTRLIVSSLRPDQYNLVYQFLYENSKRLFGKNEPEAIIVIAEHLHRGSQAGLPDITLCACMVQLSKL